MSRQKSNHRGFSPSKRCIDRLTFTNVKEAQAALYDTRFCDQCGKLGLKSEEGARSYIGLQLRTRRRPKPGSFAWHPYRCRHGNGWHVGRNPKVLRLNFASGSVSPLPITVPLYRKRFPGPHSGWQSTPGPPAAQRIQSWGLLKIRR